MSNEHRRRGCRRYRLWFVIALVVLALLNFVVPACRFAEFLVLSNVTHGSFDQYFPTALGPLTTSQESLFLSPYENTLYAEVQQLLPDGHTYLINSNTGSLTATLDTQNVFNADQQFYFTSLDSIPPGGPEKETITASRLSDNHAAWQHTFSPSPLSSTTQLANGILYLASDQEGGTGPSVLYAFAENTGTLLWQHEVKGSNGFFFTLKNGFVYILGRQGIEALDASNGSVRWFHAETTTGYSIIADTTTVYILGEAIQALRIDDGQQRWAISPGSSSFPYPLLYDYLGMQHGVMYVSANSFFFAIEASDGKILWTHPLSPRLASKLYLVDTTIYSVMDRDVYAFRTSDGSQSWHFHSQSTATSSQSTRLLGVVNGTVYVQLHNDLVALRSASGQKVWNLALPSSININAIMNGQSIYFGYALHTSNAPPPPHFVLSISQAFYYCSNLIKIFAISGQSGTTRWQKQYKVICTK